MTIGYSRPLALWTVTTSTWAPAWSPTGESPSSRAALGLLLEVADEGAEGGGAGGLVGPGDVEGLPEVRDALVALGAEAVGGEGAGLLEEAHDDVARGADAAQAVQAGQEVEGAADAVGASGPVGDRGQVVEEAALRHELQEVVVGEAEEGRAERGEDGRGGPPGCRWRAGRR